MGMSPGNQAITGGVTLRSPAIRSPDYVPGVSGWTVNIDGTAEFNNGTFRGSLEVGSDPGQHFIVNNPSTGDVIDVYDSANNLIFAITNQGKAASYATGSTPQPDVHMQNAKLFFTDNDAVTPHQATVEYVPPASSAAQGSVVILSNPVTNATGSLEVLSGSEDASKPSTIMGVERNKQGSIVVTDQQSTNNLVRMAHFSGTTDASGQLSIANAASFNIVGGVVMRDQTGGVSGSWCGGCQNYGTTTLNTKWLTWNGTAVVTLNNTAVAGTYMVFG